MLSLPSHVTALLLVQRASIDARRACELLSEVGADWLGAQTSEARPGTRRYLSDLSFPVRERAPQLTFRKAAYVELGEVRATPDGCVAEISWQSSSLAPLFPVFAGHLTVSPTELRLEGYYAPPGGGIGAALDRAFLNIAARGTARWFLERAVEGLEPASTVTADPPRIASEAALDSAGSTDRARSNSRSRTPEAT
jgi:hypothetical protein